MVLGTRGFPAIQGGVEKHCEELFPRLQRLGCDVTVFTRRAYFPPERRLKEWKGVKFIHLWAPRQKNLEAITHTFIGVIIARLRAPHILHIHAIGPSLLIPLARLLGLKVIMTHHGPDYERKKWGKLAKMVLRLGERMGSGFASKVIAISEGIKRHIENLYDREDVVVIPNGVVLPEKVPPGETLRFYGLTPGGYVFTATRFVAEKGLTDLIEAYRLIDNPPFKLVIAGGADHETPYSRRVKEMGGETAGVVLTGFVTGRELAELYSNAGLFVLPSYYEGLPIALLEAMSYGILLLVSDIPPHREFPLPPERYFPPGDIQKLSQKMNELFHRGLFPGEAEKYRRQLENYFNWDKIAQKTLQVYSEVVSP